MRSVPSAPSPLNALKSPMPAPNSAMAAAEAPNSLLHLKALEMSKVALLKNLSKEVDA